MRKQREPQDAGAIAQAKRAKEISPDEQIQANQGIPEEVRDQHPEGAMISEQAPVFPDPELDTLPLKKMIRDGEEGGYPTVGFDPEKRRAFHLDSFGERIYHDTPPGCRYTKDGVLEEKDGGK